MIIRFLATEDPFKKDYFFEVWRLFGRFYTLEANKKNGEFKCFVCHTNKKKPIPEKGGKYRKSIISIDFLNFLAKKKKMFHESLIKIREYVKED